MTITTTATRPPLETESEADFMARLSEQWRHREPYALPDHCDPSRIWLLENPCPFYIETDATGKWSSTFRWWDVPAIPGRLEGFPTKEMAIAYFAEKIGDGIPLFLYDPLRPRRLWLFSEPLRFSCDLQPTGEWAVVSHRGATPPTPEGAIYPTPQACCLAFLRAVGRAQGLTASRLRGMMLPSDRAKTANTAAL